MRRPTMTMAIGGIIGFAIALQPAWMGIPIFGAPRFDQTTLWWKILAIVLSLALTGWGAWRWASRSKIPPFSTSRWLSGAALVGGIIGSVIYWSWLRYQWAHFNPTVIVPYHGPLWHIVVFFAAQHLLPTVVVTGLWVAIVASTSTRFGRIVN